MAWEHSVASWAYRTMKPILPRPPNFRTSVNCTIRTSKNSLRLRPDLVVINNAQAPFLEDTLKELGLRVLKTSNRSIQEVYAAMIAIGHATGNEGEAARLVAATREGLDRVARKTAASSQTASGADCQPDARNIARSEHRDRGQLSSRNWWRSRAAGLSCTPAKSGYAKLSKEDLLAANPDIILDFIHGPKSRFAGDPLEAWREMPELKAVRAHRVQGVNEDFVPHASQRWCKRRSYSLS